MTEQDADEPDHPTTHTVTTPVTDDLRHALALPIEIAGAEL